MNRRANQIISVVVLMLAISFSTSTRSVDGSEQTTENGKVRGAVFDPNEALIPKAKFVIEGRDFRREVSSNDDGQFEAEVPAGVYRITSEQGTFYTLKRASFRVAPNSVTVLNIRPALRITSIALVVSKAGSSDRVTYDRPPKYQTFSGRQRPIRSRAKIEYGVSQRTRPMVDDASVEFVERRGANFGRTI